MYKFILDSDKTLYLPGDEECVVKEPEINLTLNEAGSLKFRLPPRNPYYDSLHLRQSMITVFRDEAEIFCGEVRENQKNGDLIRDVYCAGELTFLHNSMQPQVVYGTITPAVFLQRVIAVHNSQVEARQQFTLGTVTITAGQRSLSLQTDHNDTLEAIRSQLIDILGGVLRIRKEGGVRYLDYVTLDEYGPINSQGVTFGENMMEYAEKKSANNVVTAVIPRGAAIDDDTTPLQKYVDITSVNNGLDYLINTTAVGSFGYVWKVVDFKEITDPAALKAAGWRYLTDLQYEDLELTLTAADLSQMDSSMEAFDLGDRIPVYAEPYGMDRTIPVKSLTLYPQAPQNERLKLSANLARKSTYTAAAAKTTAEAATAAGATANQDAINAANEVMRKVVALSARLTGSSGGYKLSEFDANGQWQRDLYMDAPTAAGAQNIMEISMAGIAFSSSGYNGPYQTAWTIAGALNASRILTGVLTASLIKMGILADTAGKASWDMATGAFNAQDAVLVDPIITGAAGSIASSVGTKSLALAGAKLTGSENGTEIGSLDMKAPHGEGNAVVMAANGEMYLEIGAESQLHIVQVDGENRTEIGFFDASGWNGPVVTE